MSRLKHHNPGDPATVAELTEQFEFHPCVKATAGEVMVNAGLKVTLTVADEKRRKMLFAGVKPTVHVVPVAPATCELPVKETFVTLVPET